MFFVLAVGNEGGGGGRTEPSPRALLGLFFVVHILSSLAYVYYRHYTVLCKIRGFGNIEALRACSNPGPPGVRAGT